MKLPFAWEHAVGLLGLVLLVIGQYMGLFASPPEQMMGDVARILYVHVPAAWLSMLTFTIAFVAASLYAFTSRPRYDYLVDASVEVGVVLTVLLLVLGSIFARPTWGVWWDWDPRLTASAVMLLTFVGVMVLRRVLPDPSRRALWSSIATIMAYVNIPITYLSVRWWRSLHQMQSSTSTVSKTMADVLWINTLAFTLIAVWFIARRWRIAKEQAASEMAPPLPEEELS